MRKVYQEIQHDPDNGLMGDCYRACVASILDRSLEEVPHFYRTAVADISDDELEAINKRREEWFDSSGLRIVSMAYADVPEHSLISLIKAMSHNNPGLHFILTGGSPRHEKVNHCVVCCDGWIVHDPAGENEPAVTKPCWDTGHYHIEIIVGKLA